VNTSTGFSIEQVGGEQIYVHLLLFFFLIWSRANFCSFVAPAVDNNDSFRFLM